MNDVLGFHEQACNQRLSRPSPSAINPLIHQSSHPIGHFPCSFCSPLFKSVSIPPHPRLNHPPIILLTPLLHPHFRRFSSTFAPAASVRSLPPAHPSPVWPLSQTASPPRHTGI